MGADKNSSRRKWKLQQDEHGFQHTSPIHYLSYGHPWARYLGGYQDRLLGGPLRLLDLCCMAPAGVKHKDYGGEVLE
jgi:hypothetical protein